MLLNKIIGWKRLAVFSCAFLVALLAVNMILIVVAGSVRTLNLVLQGGESDSVVVVERGARTIYTSHVAESLAASFSKLPSVEAQPLVATICYIGSSTLVIRGVSSANILSSSILSGTLPPGEGAWFVLGERTWKRLNLNVGETLTVASSIRRKVLMLNVAAVCRFGDLRDDEAVAHEATVKQLTDLPPGVVSAVIVKGIGREDVEKLLGRAYRLRLRSSSPVPGNLVVLDASGGMVRSVRLAGQIDENLELPFGFYSITFQTPNLMTVLGSILLNADSSFEATVKAEEKPVLKVESANRPVLRKPDGSEMRSMKEGGQWLFQVPPGVYYLQLGTETFTIPIFHSATFNPAAISGSMHTVSIAVLWSDGSQVSSYNLLVRSGRGEIVASKAGVSSKTQMDLVEGDYILEAYSLPFSATVSFSVPRTQDVRIILPGIGQNIERIPLQYYTQVRAVVVEQMPAVTLASMAGMSATLLTGLGLSITILLALLTMNLQNYLYLSAKDRLTLVRMMGASQGFLLRSIGVPSMLLDLMLAGAAAMGAYALGGLVLLNQLTLSGHTIISNVSATLVFSFALALLVWLLGYVKAIRKLDEAAEE